MMKWTQGPLRNEAGEAPEGGTATLGSEPSSDTGSQTTGSLTDGPSAATETGSWRDHLSVSDDVKNWEGYNNIKDPSDAVTQLWNAQKMMGSEKMLKPQESWTEDQWTEHYKELGVPETPELYQLPDVPEVLKETFSDDDKKAYQDLFKKANLTPQQAEILMNGSNELSAAKLEALQAVRSQSQEQGLTNLQIEWGDEFGAKMDVAKAAVRKIGGDDLVKALNETGTAQHPAFIKAFAEAGQHYMESGGGKGPLSTGMIVSNQAQASQLLKERSRDAEWTKALMDKNHPAHDDVVKERMELYAIAAGSQ